MKKLSKKVFLLPLCALIANPFSAAFAVKSVKGKSDHKHYSSASYEKKSTRKPKCTLVMTEKKIEGCCKSDDDKFVGTGTFGIAKFVNGIKRGITTFGIVMKDFLKSGQMFVRIDEVLEESATPVFRDHPELRDTFEAKISEYNRLLDRISLCPSDKVYIKNFVRDLSVSISTNGSYEDFLVQFQRCLDENPRVRLILENRVDLISFFTRTLKEFSNRDQFALGMHFLFKCLRIALV